MIHRPQRYRIILGFILGLIISMIVFGVAYFYYLNHEKEMKEQEKAAIQQEAVDKYIQEHPTKVVYALAQDKKAGEVLSDTDFAATEINEELVPADAVLEPSFAVGKVMRSDMKQNTILTESLYYEEKDYPDDMRLLEYTVVNLPQKLDVNEFVDLRIMLPTGSDYIVLSKKRVIDLQRPTPENPKNIIWFHALEEEILRMTSAIVDASFVDGAILYAVPYVAPDVQDEAIQTYPPNIEVQNLIIQNPNILEKAITELEARNRKLFEENVNNCFESMGKNRVFTNDNQVLLPVPDDNAGNPGSGTSIEDNL
ncbi:MAG: SAF domain-containing protein [Acetivibrionales bacterium]|nr:hypothetical protein [Clostridiaceae bacterium]